MAHIWSTARPSAATTVRRGSMRVNAGKQDAEPASQIDHGNKAVYWSQPCSRLLAYPDGGHHRIPGFDDVFDPALVEEHVICLADAQMPYRSASRLQSCLECGGIRMHEVQASADHEDGW